MKWAKKQRLFSVVILAIILAAGVSAVQATTTAANYGPFRVTFYNDGDTDGTNVGEQNWTAEQMGDVAASIASWDDVILDTPGRQIELHMFWQEMNDLGTNVLGGSSSPSFGNGTKAWNYGEGIWRDGATTPGPWTGWDSVIRYDANAAGTAWNFGSDAPSSGEIDFRSVISHEIGHSIGFSTTYDSNPIFDDWGNSWGTASNPYGWAGYQGLKEWDKNLIDQAGNSPQSGGTGTPGNFDQVGDVYFTGPIAVASFGGPVPVYSPDTWESGSSLSHLDDGSVFPKPLMSPGIALGEIGRGPTDVEVAVLADIGYDVVPEPATLVVLGFGAVAILFRRKR